MMDFINSTLGIIVSILTLTSLCGGGGYMVYKRMTKVKHNKGNVQDGTGNNIISGTGNVTIVGDNNVVQTSPNDQKSHVSKEKRQKDLTHDDVGVKQDISKTTATTMERYPAVDISMLIPFQQTCKYSLIECFSHS